VHKRFSWISPLSWQGGRHDAARSDGCQRSGDGTARRNAPRSLQLADPASIPREVKLDALVFGLIPVPLTAVGCESRPGDARTADHNETRTAASRGAVRREYAPLACSVTSAAIEKRQEHLKALAYQVWDMPVPATPADPRAPSHSLGQRTITPLHPVVGGGRRQRPARLVRDGSGCQEREWIRSQPPCCLSRDR
jgi:hypothetical protein